MISDNVLSRKDINSFYFPLSSGPAWLVLSNGIFITAPVTKKNRFILEVE
jgi:hypothetical protein